MDRNTKAAITPGDAPATPAFVLGVFNKGLVLLLVADVKALRNHIAQVFGMYSRAAFHIKLSVCKGHDYKFLHSCDSLGNHCYAAPARKFKNIFPDNI